MQKQIPVTVMQNNSVQHFFVFLRLSIKMDAQKPDIIE